MRKFFRVLLSFLTAVAAMTAIQFACVVPYRLNVRKKFVRTRTIWALADAPEYTQKVVARRNIHHITESTNWFNWDAESLTIRAANYRILGQSTQAIADYEKALTFDERPETHVQLGDALLAIGRPAEAALHYQRAAEFSRIYSQN